MSRLLFPRQEGLQALENVPQLNPKPQPLSLRNQKVRMGLETGRGVMQVWEGALGGARWKDEVIKDIFAVG